jgi:hypothetical protein
MTGVPLLGALQKIVTGPFVLGGALSFVEEGEPVAVPLMVHSGDRAVRIAARNSRPSVHWTASHAAMPDGSQYGSAERAGVPPAPHGRLARP